ncbi:MAG: hypothetical protein Q8M03_04805 [Legionella sp.]|nr:hypothetical protein [Legionella sp.]
MKSEINKKSALTARFAATLFFAIYALLFLLFTKYTLLSFQNSLRLPLFPSFLIALLAGAILGRLFVKKLAQKSHWFRVFLWGCLVALIAILFISLFVLVYSYFYDASFLNHLPKWQDYFIIYGLVVLSVTLVVGVWLIPLTGFAAIYFNKHFLPGLLAVNNTRHE